LMALSVPEHQATQDK